MEVLVMAMVLITGLAALGATSIRRGVDSRPQMPDDHTR